MSIKKALWVGLYPVFCVLLSIQNVQVHGSGKIDSLQQVISGLDDSKQKAESLLLLAQEFYNNQMMDSASFYVEKAYGISTKLNIKTTEAEAVYKRGLIQNRLDDYNAALVTFKTYVDLIKPLNDQRGLGKGYFNLGSQLMKRGMTDSALYYYRLSLDINFVLNDTMRFIAIYNSMGALFHKNLSKYDSAAFYYLEASRLCKASGKEHLLGRVYENLGQTLSHLGEYDESNKYLEMALEYNRKAGDTRGMALDLVSIGINYSNQKENERALEYYDQASELLKPFGEVLETMDLYNNYALIYKDQGKYDLAIQYYYKALNYFRALNQHDRVIALLKNIGVAYSVQKKYALAQEKYDSCLAIANQYGYSSLRMSVLEAIYYNYMRSGDYRNAFEYQQKYHLLRDSIFDLDKTRLINDLKLKYEKELDQARIVALEKDNIEKDLDLQKRTTQRNAYLYTALTIIFIAAFLFLYIRQRTEKDKIIAQQKIRQLEEEKKLMAAKLLLEGQENERKRIASELHDGLGVLLSATKMQFSSIIDKSPENKELIDRATKMLEQASGDVRKISHNMMPGLLTKLGLYEAVEDLLENINETKGLVAVCSILGNTDGRLAENREIMLYRIVQEMVNNTLKHAGAENIKLQVQVLPEMLDITYVDDGIGFDFKQKLEAESLGLKSIKSRVDFLNGILTVESNPGEGAKYSIQVPI